MGTRFAVFALVLAGVLVCAFFSLKSGQSSVLEVFVWLGLILVVSGIALWPTTGRDQRAELKLERLSWADRIEFKEPSPAPRSSASERGIPVESRTSRAG